MNSDPLRTWADTLLAGKTVGHKFKLVAVAHSPSKDGRSSERPMANKLARIIFALLTQGGEYDDRAVPVAA